MDSQRYATVSRHTQETRIEVQLQIDGQSVHDVQTGEAFFDHMLNQLSKHSGMDLKVRCEGDLDIDCHHTVEDTGIVIGQAFAKAMQDKRGIRRYGQASVPMDEALAVVSVDLSGRPFLHFDAAFPAEQLGTFETETVQEFMRAFAQNAQITLHITVPYGENTHHKIEAMFKALAVALASAVSVNPQLADRLPSTKGML